MRHDRASGTTRHNQHAAPAGQVTRWHTDQQGHRRIPVPTGREEEWRFTPLRRLRGLPPWGPNKITEDGRGQLRALGFNVWSPHTVPLIPGAKPVYIAGNPPGSWR
jgi:hypothetical protein